MPRPATLPATLAAIALTTLACGDSGGSLGPPPAFFDGPTPRVIAHRGGADRAPESTLLGFETGLALGAQILETDAHTTRDGVVVLLHDATVDRTTDGSGRIHDLTLAEAKRLDAAYDFRLGGETPYRGTGVTIPTLDEAFARFPRERFLIEIKQSDPPIEEALLAVIDRHDMRDRVCLASFIDAAVQRVRALAPDLCTSASLSEVVDLVLRPVSALEGRLAAKATQFPFDVLGQPLVTRAIVDKHHALGLEIHVWTVDDADDMRGLVALGVDGIITDRPDTLRDVIAEHGGAR